MPSYLIFVITPTKTKPMISKVKNNWVVNQELLLKLVKVIAYNVYPQNYILSALL